MGISNDITPKHLPKRKPDTQHANNAADEASDFDVAILKNSGAEELPATEIVDQNDLKKKNNDKLAEEFFDKKQFRENKKTQISAETTQATSATKPKAQSSLLNIKFLWTLFVVLLIILGWQNFGIIKKIFVKVDAPSVATTEETADTATERVEQPTQETQTTTPTTQTPAATAPLATTTTPVAPIIDKASITIKVLNGNGITGRAATVTSLLITAGFKVASTTNAKRFTYATTIIYFHEGKDAQANLVKDALPTYSVTTVQDNSVASTSDLVVVVGKK